MKKVLFLLILCCAGLLNSYAQVEYKDIQKLTFFGVDFSQVEVFGATETPTEFRYAFEGINTLFQIEPKKYNLYKFFNKKEVKINLETVIKQIHNQDLENLIVYTKGDLLTDEEIADHIRSFDTGEESGYGALLIANLLDKSTNTATYDLVVFDIQTKDIIKSKRERTKGKGFGLRNFWARSVYDTLKGAYK